MAHYEQQEISRRQLVSRKMRLVAESPQVFTNRSMVLLSWTRNRVIGKVALVLKRARPIPPTYAFSYTRYTGVFRIRPKKPPWIHEVYMAFTAEDANAVGVDKRHGTASPTLTERTSAPRPPPHQPLVDRIGALRAGGTIEFRCAPLPTAECSRWSAATLRRLSY